jgi:hypothetical protein
MLKKSCKSLILIFMEFNELTLEQKKAIFYCNKKSKIFSKNVLPNLEAKLNSKGYNKADILKLCEYFKKNIKVIIHTNLDNTMQFFCQDDFYRNQFEVNKSGGSLSKEFRIIWEDNLFNKIYHDSIGFDRVKYGTLNLTSSPGGVQSAYGYGDSYLIINSNNKPRITFVFGDSATQDFHIANFDNFYHILYYLDDNLLMDLIKLSNGEKLLTTFKPYVYVEAQIHGPIWFKTDVEKICVNDKHKNDPNMLQLLNNFTMEHGTPWEWISHIG